jgi:DNA-binding NarL/FixJ family response regulator
MDHHPFARPGRASAFAESSTSPAMVRPLNILLIEDSAELRETLSQSIEASGALTLKGIADNSEDAIRMLDSGTIDAAVIDLHLREGSGLMVLAHLARSGNPHNVLRIVLTNHVTPMFRRSCERLGLDHFLDKSLEFDRAIELLEEYAALRRGTPDPA